MKKFDFGKNWEEFSKRALTTDKVKEAKKDFFNLFNNIELDKKSFLDIGFGQGLSLLIASEAVSKAVGCEIDARCIDILNRNKKFFKPLEEPQLIVGSILGEDTMQRLQDVSPVWGFYDIVHSWGVLHHTGRMFEAITNAASLVKPGGFLVLALYNQHWSSPIWKAVKKMHCNSPLGVKKIMVFFSVGLIWLAKIVVTKKWPAKKERGMDFFYDCIDWVGGYPYEYAAADKIVGFVSLFGFEMLKVNPPVVPTGCNEFVFKKNIFNAERR